MSFAEQIQRAKTNTPIQEVEENESDALSLDLIKVKPQSNQVVETLNAVAELVGVVSGSERQGARVKGYTIIFVLGLFVIPPSLLSLSLYHQNSLLAAQVQKKNEMKLAEYQEFHAALVNEREYICEVAKGDNAVYAAANCDLLTRMLKDQPQ